MKQVKAIFLFLFFLFFTGETQVPPKSWVADLTTTVLFPGGHQTSSITGKFYQNGLKIRYEPADSEEVNLYDFERSIGLRIFPVDRIYFENRLTAARILKAMKEGWIPPHPPYQETRIFLREGKMKEKEAKLFLIILQEREKKDYSLRWVTADEAAFPLQVIYPAPGYETVIIDYDHPRLETLDLNQFQPPPEFLNVNPF